jgi:hypothetical protein
MRISLTLLISILLIPEAFSQVLQGNIKDVEGQPVSYATVYIQELKQGTTSNSKGDYEIRLPDGKYTVVYQSLGYVPEFRNVTLNHNTLSINVVLQVQYYEIPEVRITPSGEDPAYGIMRKAIGLAPYYLNQVSYYKADVYLKGNLVINRIPKIIQRRMKAEARRGSGTSSGSPDIKEGDSYMMESMNEIEFTAPDQYIQHVLSSHSTFPEQGNSISPMDFIQASFYEPVLLDMFISPLSPDAFSHYRFKYDGASVQGNFFIDKIQVIPKRKSQQLFEGTIYIIEDLWCLHSVDLVNENIAGKVRIEQLYIPVEENIWMPVSHKFEINIAIIGFRADAGYGSSIKYLDVEPNHNLEKPQSLTADYTGNLIRPKPIQDNEISKTGEKIENILAKEELTNRDMIKLSNLMKKQTEESIPDSIKNNLEIKDKTTYVIDEDAGKKDSTYWAEIRPIPLSDAESKSIRISDSVKAKLIKRSSGSDTSLTEVRKKGKFVSAVKHITSGYTWSDTLGTSFTNGGLLKLKNLSFNTVDGFVYGIDFRFNKTWKKKTSLGLYPDFRWAFSRNTLMWRLNGQYSFDRSRQGQVYLRSGITSKDINNNGSINTFINSITTLLMKRNYLKLYESRYLTLGYRSELTNGLYLDLSAGYEDRRVLMNNTDFALIKTSREYSDNIPDNTYLENPVNPGYELSDQKHGAFTTTFTYTPSQKYTLRDGVKIPRGSDYPTFKMTWTHGINKVEGTEPETKHFDLLKFEVSERQDIGAFGEFRWRYRSGGFLNNTRISYFDFFHFNAQPLLILFSDYEDAFMLPEFYSLSTPEFFSELHMKYTSPYLLIKLLPVISNSLMRENVSMSFLWSRYHEAYTEIGYSISELLLIGEAGVYAGFNNFNFSSIGAKIVFRFN